MEEKNSISPISDKELKFGYWFLTKKQFFKNLLVAFLILLNVMVWGYSFWKVMQDFIINLPERERLLSILPQDLANFKGLRAQNEPSAPEISSVEVISTGQGRYDFVARIKNPNSAWAVSSFNYQFRSPGFNSEKLKGFILPGEEKFIMKLGAISSSRPSGVIVDISDVRWQRVNAHEITNYQDFYNSRLGLKIENIKFNYSSALGLGEKLPVSSATFDVYNNTAYNYWQVGFYVSLYRGGTLAAVNYVTAKEFKSGDRVSLEARWFEPLSSVSEVRIEPEVNILAPEVYMEFKGTSEGWRR
ncbi:MAG: hypothetical protein PHD51_02235 [Patescibacteria group bacterium]|nr:hypothetical protein [Patescibacteria group bacterium]MDD5490320.1 hypothetical protein [Patescibacteria group bacterium]